MHSKLPAKVLAMSLSWALAGSPLLASAAEPAASPGGAAANIASAGILKSGVYLQNLDKSVRPQDDFYRHINGGWLAATQIPADRSNYGAFTKLQEDAEHDLRDILEEAAKSKAAAGSDAQKVGDYYASFLDEATVEARGLKPLSAELSRIDALKTPQDIAGYIGHAQRLFVAQPFAYYVAVDEKNSSQYVSTLTQTGLGMPDRDYYLSKDDARLKSIREKYEPYVRDLLALADTPDAAGAAKKIYAIESRIAQAHWTRVQNRDAEKTYNRYDRAALGKLMPSFDWDAFLRGAQIPSDKVPAMVVTQPSYFQALDRLFAEVPVADWRVYFRYKLLNTYAPDLPARFVQRQFEFNDRTVSGIEELKPRWKRGVDTIEGAVGDLVGKMYVERHFKPEQKQRIDALVKNLLAAFDSGIDQLEWMTPDTKRKAHEKLALFTTKIGYPDKWRDWSKLQIRRDDLVGNEMRAAAVVFERGVSKLGGPIDRTEWLMTPQTVNAYYNPPTNEIVFPAAMLQPPFFDVTVDDATNYGAIGAVIGHEISHGFDDQGRRYDGHGNLHDWWAPADNDEFTRRAKAFGAQYDASSPLPGTHVNGDLTMGENIADLAGVAMAYRAYKLSLKGKQAPVIDGYTGDQRFFTGWAQGWARKYRDDELRRRLLTDPHSPSEYRTNIIVANLPEFYRAFDVKPGDKMYRAPAQRVKIW
ncbi:MAG TPA: M13-type metalloendopeptidase [Steroidobacteraceae bacterium]|nr:M13-type metalloendopeptidase [Steroidobacteraceae bacterium]